MSNSIARVYSDAVKKNQRRLLTISELAELKGFEIKYRTDNTKDEKFFTSSYSISFQAEAKVPSHIYAMREADSLKV